MSGLPTWTETRKRQRLELDALIFAARQQSNSLKEAAELIGMTADAYRQQWNRYVLPTLNRRTTFPGRKVKR